MAALGLSCDQRAFGIFPDPGLNLHLLHYKADSPPLGHQGSPWVNFYIFCEERMKVQTLNPWSFISSVQFSCSVVSDSLRPHESQHARPPCPSPTPGVHSNSCSLSWWCHSAISSSVVPFSSCPQPLPATESFPMSQLFAWGGQSIGVSALASVLSMNTQDWSPLEWTGWISLQSKGLSRPVADSCWCMAKPIQYCKVISL